MGQTIWPSYNDVGDTEGDGTILTEDRVKDIIGKVLTHPGLLEGGAPTNPSGLTVRVAVGKAFIDGRYCEWDAYMEVAATASATSYQFLRLDIDGSDRATSVSLETRSSPVPPSDRYVLVARSISGSSTITNLYDERLFAGAGTKSGFYTGDGTSSRSISVGRTPTLVMVWKIDGNSDNIIGLGGVDPAGRRVAGNGSLAPSSRVYFTAGVQHTLPKIIYSQQTWNSAGSIGSGGYEEHDFTVSGAAVGDGVIIMPTTVGIGCPTRTFSFSGQVVAANTVRATAQNFTGSSYSFGDDFDIIVIDRSGVTTYLDVANFVSATLTDSKVPTLEPGGFTVTASGSPNLNASGWNYGWIAFF